LTARRSFDPRALCFVFRSPVILPTSSSLYSQAIAKLGWRKPTMIQSHVIKHALAGKDILARARTGSGKTGAYALAMLHSVLTAKTREVRFRPRHQSSPLAHAHVTSHSIPMYSACCPRALLCDGGIAVPRPLRAHVSCCCMSRQGRRGRLVLGVVLSLVLTRTSFPLWSPIRHQVPRAASRRWCWCPPRSWRGRPTRT